MTESESERPVYTTDDGRTFSICPIHGRPYLTTRTVPACCRVPATREDEE